MLTFFDVTIMPRNAVLQEVIFLLSDTHLIWEGTDLYVPVSGQFHTACTFLTTASIPPAAHPSSHSPFWVHFQGDT